MPREAASGIKIIAAWPVVGGPRNFTWTRQEKKRSLTRMTERTGRGWCAEKRILTYDCVVIFLIFITGTAIITSMLWCFWATVFASSKSPWHDLFRRGDKTDRGTILPANLYERTMIHVLFHIFYFSLYKFNWAAVSFGLVQLLYLIRLEYILFTEVIWQCNVRPTIRYPHLLRIRKFEAFLLEYITSGFNQTEECKNLNSNFYIS